MREVREILRLRWGLWLAIREVTRSCLVFHSTLLEVLARAESAGLSWPLPENLDEAALEARLYPPPPKAKDAKPTPDMEYIKLLLVEGSLELLIKTRNSREASDDIFHYAIVGAT